jgi:polysaccharide export outer membrane protein
MTSAFAPVPAAYPLPAARLTRSLGRAVLGATALLLLVASAQAQFNGPADTKSGAEINRPTLLTTDRSVLFPPAHDVVLEPGDVLAIHLFGQAEYQPTARVAIDGTLQLPLIGVISLRGLSVTQAEQLIAAELEKDGMYRNPQVTIQITEGPNSAVTVIGEAHGLIPVAGSRRLLDVLSAAGGLPNTASHTVTINRPGVDQPIVVNLGSDPMRSELGNIPVYPGDTVVVARIGIVYMIGEFKTPGVINLTPYAPLTLLQATAMSGGLAYGAKSSDLRIIRTIGDRRTVVKLDAHAVLYGKAPDPILQPNDIVFLPTSTIKSAIQQGGIGALLGAAGLAISAIAYSR